MTPAKCFAEMKDSGIHWMGRIPNNWKLIRAKFHFTQTNNRGNETPILLAASQKYGVCPQSWLEGVVQVSENTDLQQFKTVHKNDFVISLRSFQGGFERSDFEGVCSPAYQVFHADNSFDNNFLKYLFKNELFIDEMNSLTVGIREGRNIKYEDFANSLIFVPPLDEQTAIAAYLDTQCAKIDEIIAQAKASIEDYKQWKASIIYEAVTKGLDPNVEMKDSGVEWVGMIPKHWTIIANKYVMHKEKRICEKWNGQDVLSLTMNGVIIRDILNPVGKMPTTFDGYQFAYAGELLMCLFDIDVTPRCVGRVFNDGVTSPAYSCFQLNNNADLGYFYYYYLMVDNTKELLHLAKNLRHSFTEEQLGQLKVPLPPLREQSAIASYLDTQCAKIDELVAKKQSLIDDLESYKKSLIYEVVTGKRRVY